MENTVQSNNNNNNNNNNKSSNNKLQRNEDRKRSQMKLRCRSYHHDGQTEVRRLLWWRKQKGHWSSWLTVGKRECIQTPHQLPFIYIYSHKPSLSPDKRHVEPGLSQHLVVLWSCRVITAVWCPCCTIRRVIACTLFVTPTASADSWTTTRKTWSKRQSILSA